MGQCSHRWELFLLSYLSTVCAGWAWPLARCSLGLPWKGEQGEGAEEGHRSCDPGATLPVAAGVTLPVRFPACGCGNPGVCLEKTPACVDGLVALVQAQVDAGLWPGETDTRKLAMGLLDRADRGEAAAWGVIRVQMMLLGMILAELHRTYKSPVYCCPGAYRRGKISSSVAWTPFAKASNSIEVFRDANDPPASIYPGSCGENAAVYGGLLFAALQSHSLRVAGI